MNLENEKWVQVGSSQKNCSSNFDSLGSRYLTFERSVAAVTRSPLDESLSCVAAEVEVEEEDHLILRIDYQWIRSSFQ